MLMFTTTVVSQAVTFGCSPRVRVRLYVSLFRFGWSERFPPVVVRAMLGEEVIVGDVRLGGVDGVARVQRVVR